MKDDMTKLDFTKLDGLLPIVVQDAHTNKVLMVGFMNQEAYHKTLETGYVYFWSRTRGSLWMKGETSGNKLKLEELFVDCDNDTVLAKVHIEGDGVCCHTGAESCFYTKIST